MVGSQEVLTCTDTDGLNFTSLGHIYGVDLNNTNYTKYDYCSTNNSTVLEYGCYEGNVTYAALVAQNCGDFGMGCINGACVNQTQNQTNDCTDTDGGIEYFDEGTLNALGNDYTDFCFVAGDDEYILEYYCSDQPQIIYGTTRWLCPNGCENGQCLPPTECTDSDGGDNVYVAGVTVGNNDGYGVYREDFCLDEDTVFEYFCWGIDVVQGSRNCESQCVDGACLMVQNQTGFAP